MNELVTIATFDNSVLANIAKGKLESEGIRAFLENERTLETQWLWSNASGGIRLVVVKGDVQRRWNAWSKTMPPNRRASPNKICGTARPTSTRPRTPRTRRTTIEVPSRICASRMPPERSRRRCWGCSFVRCSFMRSGWCFACFSAASLCDPATGGVPWVPRSSAFRLQ